MGWIRIRNFCPDPELGKFKVGSGSGINNSGSTTLVLPAIFTFAGCFEKFVHLLLPVLVYYSFARR